MLTYQLSHSPWRCLPHGSWRHSRERRVGTHEPQSAVSGASLHHALALSSSLILLCSMLRMGHGLVSANCCLLGRVVRVAARSRQLLPVSQPSQLCHQLFPPAGDKPMPGEDCKWHSGCSSCPSCLGPANGNICLCPVPRERPGPARCS